MDMHGFREVRERDLSALRVRARLLRHDGSGAELLALEGEDPNLTFAAGFPTMPSDDSGVAHILEHMVLAGSERYPLKDPFFEMIKGSLAGFLNAMTYPDRTVYPFATENPQDFLNLLGVYLDAVFRPRLSKETFDQEAWHLEPGEEPRTLRLRGVVYNEMKGAGADPARALGLAEMGGLFPDTGYRHDSGGDPAAIPELTHEALRAFHFEHYHPSRARFVVHGDVPLEATLRTLADYLEGVERLDAMPPPALQAPFDAPREVRSTYPSDARGKAFATVSWALPEPGDPSETMALDLLEHVLVGSPAAPLRRALLDSGLGEAFIGGLGGSLRQPTFHAGLRGVAPDATGRVHDLVVSTLQEAARRGLSDEDLQAARNRLEFDLRELDVFGGQRGVALALTALGAWLHGRDPLDELAYERALAALDDRLPDGAASLTRLLERSLIDNEHRIRVTVEPDPELSERRTREENERLAARAAALPDSAHEAIRGSAAELRRHQEAPDEAAAKDALPRLTREDLGGPRPKPPLRDEERDGARVVTIEEATAGLVYLDLGFDLRALPERLLPHAGLLGRILLETGTARRGLTELSRAIDRDTGGIGPSLELLPGVDGEPGVARFFLRGRALATKSEALSDLLVEILREAAFDDGEAIRRLAVEDLARRRAALEPAGHRFAMRRLAAHASQEGRVLERLSGLASLDGLAAFAERAASDAPAVRGELEELRERLLVRDALVLGVTADEASASAARAGVERILAGLPPGSGERPGWSLDAPGHREGWTLPGQVHYMATGRAVGSGSSVPGGWLAAARYLSADVLIPRVRFQGGAYGAGASVDPLTGEMICWSYRDPNLTATLAVFDEAPALLREAADAMNDRDFDTLVIGAVGALDPHALPGARGHRALLRRLRGSEGQVERVRSELLAADRDAFRELAGAVERSADPALAILGPRDSLERAAPALDLDVRDPG